MLVADSEHVVAGNFAMSSQESCVLILELSATTFAEPRVVNQQMKQRLLCTVLIFGLAYDVAIAVTYWFCNIVLGGKPLTLIQQEKVSVEIRGTYWSCSWHILITMWCLLGNFFLFVHLIGIQRNMTCVICLPGGYLHHLFGHGGIAFLDSTFPRRMFPPERDSCR